MCTTSQGFQLATVGAFRVVFTAPLLLVLSMPSTAEEAVDSEQRSADSGNLVERSADDRDERERAGERNHVLEGLILEFLAHQPKLELTSITSVRCDKRQCTIEFTGKDMNPQYVGAYDELHFALMRQRWRDFAPLQGGIAVREISPGINGFAMGFQYRTYEDLSRDPTVAARQHATCAGVWEKDAAREEARGRLENAARIRATVERELDLAARVLGRVEAEQVAAQATGSTLFRECRKPPLGEVLTRPAEV